MTQRKRAIGFALMDTAFAADAKFVRLARKAENEVAFAASVGVFWLILADARRARSAVVNWEDYTEYTEQIVSEGVPEDALRRATPTRPSITRWMREAVAQRNGAERGQVTTTTCSYCPTSITIDWTARRVRFVDVLGRVSELDHRDPLALGGAHSVENLVMACRPCNRAKAARPIGATA